MSLRDIRTRIGSVKNTQQVTRAMKMVAAAKLRKAQEGIFRARPYAFKIGEVISHLKRHVDPASHPLFSLEDVSPGVCLVIVTADRGLAGGFNNNLIKVAEKTIREKYATEHANGDLYLICVGRKGHEHFARRGYQLIGDHRGAFDKLSFDTASTVSSVTVEGYQSRKWDQVFLIYNEFKNTISQNRVVEPFLPIPSEHFLTPVMEEREEVDENAGRGGVDYLFEPDAATILDQLVPKYLNFQVWRALLESNASEQGARMVAMDSATNNAEDLLKELKLKYNRARQDAITKELIEITSGADALG
jgi:F-type H+-transporting ATPase subunit gamma